MDSKAQTLLRYKEAARHEPSYFIEDMRRVRPDDLDALTANILRVAMSAAYEKHGEPREVISVMRTLIEHEIHRQAELHVHEVHEIASPPA
jgi:hypothetical protein